MFEIKKDVIQKNLDNTLMTVDIEALGSKIKGKVRDCYVKNNKRVLISSDRLSAFDVILTSIPFKGKLLNDLTAFWFEKTKHIAKNHLIARPHPNIFIGQEVSIIPIEVVVRGYLAGSSYRDYVAGKPVSGVSLPSGLKKSQKFETPIITPSTKEAQGSHDMPISESEIITRNIVTKDIWDEVREVALSLFKFASNEVSERGLILVDTKYEFGLLKNKDGGFQIVLADEIHTQDSSRYWIKDSYQARFESDQDPEMLDKEFLRRWLIERGYMGEGVPPKITDEFRVELASKYIEVYQMISGEEFVYSNEAISDSVISEVLRILDN